MEFKVIKEKQEHELGNLGRKPQFHDEYHRVQRRKMRESRGRKKVLDINGKRKVSQITQLKQGIAKLKLENVRSKHLLKKRVIEAIGMITDEPSYEIIAETVNKVFDDYKKGKPFDVFAYKLIEVPTK